jgi:hypothetical protein
MLAVLRALRTPFRYLFRMLFWLRILRWFS